MSEEVDLSQYGKEIRGLAMSLTCGWLPLIETGFAYNRPIFPVERCFDTTIACVRGLEMVGFRDIGAAVYVLCLESDINDNLVAFICSNIFAHHA